MIRLTNVTKVYGDADTVALDDVSLQIAPGEFAFLVGSSGSGKSTLLRLLLREELATFGTVSVAGRDLSAMSERQVPQLRREVGCVFQDFRLLPDKTVADNVAYALRVIGKSKRHCREQVPLVLEQVGLADKADRYPGQISGGEQQRVAIARAIVNRPSVLIADEPTGNLDPTTSEEITALLTRINAEGTTIVMATHDVATVDRMARRVIELRHGQLIRDAADAAYSAS